MIRQNQRLLNAVNAVLDVFLIVAAYLLSIWLWLDVYKNDENNIVQVLGSRNVWVAVCYALVMVFVYYLFKLYGSFRFRTIWQETAALLEANVLGVLAVAAALYLFRLEDFSRGVLAVFYLLSSVLVVGKRAAVRRVLRYYRSLGYNQKHVVLVGSGRLAQQYADALKTNPQFGLYLDGYVSPEKAEGLGARLGGYDALDKLLDGPAVDEVVVALEPQQAGNVAAVLAACEKNGTKVSVVPFYNDYIPSRPTVDVIGETKLINIRTTPFDNVGNAVLKRASDILGSLLLILVTSPIMLFTAVGVRLSSPGPILFRQERVGLNKKIFIMYKFRSMRVNAQQDTAWSKNEDPRKTRFGSFIRKTSIDELPQLFNVLKGDMSLIGPRPEIPHYVEQFRETVPLYMIKHQVRPGITGWAQVNGFRGDTSIEGRIKCDIWYIENWSIWLDIKIVFMTVFGGMLNQEKLKTKKDKAA